MGTALNVATLAWILFTANHCACTQQRTQSTMPMSNNVVPISNNTSDTAVPMIELELELDTTYILTMGWGIDWGAKVRRVIRGQLSDEAIILSTLVDYGGHFACCASETGVIVSFTRLSKHPAALQGFIAEDGTIWEIADVKP